MKYFELKKMLKTNVEMSKIIYICNFITCNLEKIKKSKISIVRNVFGKYVVTLWIDYEYGKYSSEQEFTNKDLAAEYAWKLFNDL